MPYPTLADLKARLAISGSDQDAALSSALSAAVGAVQGYCGYFWEQTASVLRTFERRSHVTGMSVFDVSHPGLLSWTAATGVIHGTTYAIASKDVALTRLRPGGVGAYDLFNVVGVHQRISITGVWGQGLQAPDEVAEAVMIVAIAVYNQGLAGGYSEATAVNAADFDDSVVGFLLKGHRRYR